MILEIAWTLFAATGLWLAYLNGMESYQDWQALGGKQNGRRTIAIGNLRREIVRGLINLAWLCIGLVALAAPDRPQVHPVAVVLVLTSAGMALNSYLDRRDRRYLMLFGLQPRDEQGRFTSD